MQTYNSLQYVNDKMKQKIKNILRFEFKFRKEKKNIQDKIYVAEHIKSMKKLKPNVWK